MQCASSTTTRLTGRDATRSTKARIGEALGCREDDLRRARGERRFGRAELVGGDAAVELDGGDAELAQLVALILHQRDQRRDDQRRSRQEQGGQLIAKRLAGAGRHHRERRLAGHHMADHRLLAVAQALQAEGLAQQAREARAPGGRCGAARRDERVSVMRVGQEKQPSTARPAGKACARAVAVKTVAACGLPWRHRSRHRILTCQTTILAHRRPCRRHRCRRRRTTRAACRRRSTIRARRAGPGRRCASRPAARRLRLPRGDEGPGRGAGRDGRRAVRPRRRRRRGLRRAWSGSAMRRRASGASATPTASSIAASTASASAAPPSCAASARWRFRRRTRTSGSAPVPNGHLQATGRDARGRKQYRYHPDWRVARDADKFERMLEFGAALPRIRKRVKRRPRRAGRHDAGPRDGARDDRAPARHDATSASATTNTRAPMARTA